MENASTYEIMIIDDIPENLDCLNTLLTDHNFRTRSFKSAKIALQSTQIKAPNLILVDINMPEMDGFDFCKNIKNDDELKDIPIIFISALHEESSKISAFECGGVDYITKPFILSEVIARVETHLKIREYQKEIESKNFELKQALNELRETQAQLIHSEKMASLGVMASGIAHEINNPINSISGNAQAIKNLIDDFKKVWYSLKDLSDTEAKKLLTDFAQKVESYGYDEIIEQTDLITESIITASDRTSKIVSDLLSFVRLDDVELQLCDITNCIESTLNIIPTYKKNGIIISKNYAVIPKIMTNPGKLNQIILNLIINAIDSFENISQVSQKEIKIELSLKNFEENKVVSISFSDNGEGIPEENFNHIFDPFYSTKEVGKGTGLGLSICQGLVKTIKGTIEVKSKVGEGSCFDIQLPLITSDVSI